MVLAAESSNFIPWAISILSVLITIYSLIKANAKDDKKNARDIAVDTTTLIVKLENIQQAVNRTGDIVSSIQGEIKALDHRVTVIETKLEDD